MKLSQLLFLLFLCGILSTNLSAQNMRKAFILGENEEQYDQLRTEHARTLLTVFDNNQEEALQAWFQLLEKMEAYSEKINFEVDGLKLYLNVFWNADGSIAYIGALPKPDSKNVKKEDLVAFFSSFIRQYTPDGLTSDRKFSHYTSVAFPTFARKMMSSYD
jgi:hypothetical protein